MAHLKKKFSFIHPIYWPAWLGISLLWIIAHLPGHFQMTLGKKIGRLIYALSGKLKHITQVNIQLCFPKLSSEAQQELIQKNFESIGIGLIEAAMAWWLPDEKLQHLFKIHGLEHIEKAFTKGKGILLVGPHFTCLEMVGRIISMKYDFAVMYRPHKNRVIAFFQERFRQKHYLQTIPRHRVRQLIRALKNNQAIWYAYDVDGGSKRSVFAPFFGVEAASLTSVSRIARLSDTTIVPIGFYRQDHQFHYDIVLFPPIEPFPSENLQQDAAILNRALEEAIQRKPEQYVWQYKRFKTRPLGQPRIY